MKKIKPTIKSLFVCLITLMTIHVNGQRTVNGEIIADTNNITVIKIWGTHAERGYAHGYLLSSQIGETIEGYLIPSLESFYPDARDLITNGQDLSIDSLYIVEAKAMIEGMGASGYDTTNIDYVDILLGAVWQDLYGFAGKSNGGPGCSTFMSWGEATENTDLNGKSVISRMYDWDVIIPEMINNAAIIVHMPSEENLQPWLLVGYAGAMVPMGGGVNQQRISIYQNILIDYLSNQASYGVQYEPYLLTMRKVIETSDYNGDGLSNTMDFKDAFDTNPQGYPTGQIISCLAGWDPDSDSLTAMIAEITPTEPRLTYRTNAYSDSIPGDNLYAANRMIKRNNLRNYCYRYYNMIDNLGDGTGISSEVNRNLMKNYSASPYNYGFMQHIPELDSLKLSVFTDSTNAYDLPMTTFYLRDFFNREPQFTSQPVDTAFVGEVYNYLLEVSDPDPYDTIIFSAELLPAWLTLTDNGDGTALLQGTPDQTGIDSVKITASDGMLDITQEFEITIDHATGFEKLITVECQLYPNPFSDFININSVSDFHIRIYSLDGEKQFEGYKNSVSVQLDLSFLSTGIYILMLDNGENCISKKIVKK